MSSIPKQSLFIFHNEDEYAAVFGMFVVQTDTMYT